MELPHVFVVGCPRSGTTLVQSVIASHQDVTSFPESHFFANLTPSFWPLRQLGVASRRVHGQLDKFLKECGRSDILPHQKTIQSQHAATQSFVDCLNKIAISRKVRAWVEKTPQHLHYISKIEKFVSNSVFVHVVRAGEDVVASMYDVTHRYPEQWGGRRSLQQCIDRWNRDIGITLELCRKPNHVVVTYQEMIDRQEDVMGNLCQLIGLSKWSAAQKPSDRGVVDQITTNEEKWKSRNRRPATHGERKFVTILTDFQRQDIEVRLEKEKYQRVVQVSLLKE